MGVGRSFVRMRFLQAAVVAAVSVPGTARAQRPDSEGARPVRVDSFEISDPTRPRTIPVKVRYPVGAGPFPVIVFSHGLGAGRNAFGRISESWASHGYVVVHPTHDDGGVRMTPSGMHPAGDQVRARVRDVSAVLDGLDQLEKRIPDLAGKLDRERIAVAGHSYGAFITMMVGGTRADLGDGRPSSLADARVRCVLPVAPSGRGDYGLVDESWTAARLPTLFVNGTLDVRSGHTAEWRMEPYELSPPGERYVLVIEGATHQDFGGDKPGTRAPDFVEAASAAFWDWCLKGDTQAREYLRQPTGFARWAGSAATVRFK